MIKNNLLDNISISRYMPRAPNHKAVTLLAGILATRREGTTNSKGAKLSWSLYLLSTSIQ